MKNMIHLALRTGYSFRKCFGHINKTLEFSENGVIGVADLYNTFSHYEFEIEQKKNKNLKTIYGVRLNVVKDATKKVKPRGQWGPEYIFIAKNQEGLKEIYNLTTISSSNFYYRGNLSFSDVTNLSDNVIVISECFQAFDRLDYVALTTKTPNYIIKAAKEEGKPFVAIVNNYFPEKGDYETYELLVGSRNSELQTYPQHILSTEEFIEHQKFKGRDEDLIIEAIENTHVIASKCDQVILPKAPMIKSKSKKSIEFLCKIGAKKKGVDLKNEIYKERYDREMSLIKERNFDDYFLVVADMIEKAKKKMLVGPGRGSSGGSLVCYLLGITEIDPIKYDLLFERFVDINRQDLPDIDIDFPDSKRDGVIKQLIKDYGDDKVKHIANISKLQPRSAIGNFAKGLGIPASETSQVKDSIIERPPGDERAKFCTEDTLKTTEAGQALLKKYPSMEVCGRAEGHPDHSSVHAAGIIVCNEPIKKFAGVNSRDNTVMCNKVSAEYQNLLKIDALGLRTLSILETCAKMIGMDYKDYYTLPLDDKKTFSILTEGRTNGVFQFEGHALLKLTKKMGIDNFEDIVAITALARPGALHSGGAERFIKYKNGYEEPIYASEKHKEITKKTFGIVVFQEQILKICREIGGMTWEEVNDLRKGLSKSLGSDFFDKYKEKFITGAKENNHSDEDAEFIWGEICHGGSYAFNRSHAVAYGLVSYWTAYMKAHYPLEFVVSCLNNEKDEDSSIKILRDAVENDGIEYVPIDPDNSVIDWSVVDGKIVGGLTNIKGIGVQKARKIIKCRNGEERWTPALFNHMVNPKTPFDYLWPCQRYFREIYEEPKKHGLNKPPVFIKNINGEGVYCFIGQLKNKKPVDLNDHVNLQRRGGVVLKEKTRELTMIFEDDTDSIMAGINRFNYEELGAKEIIVSGVEDEDYYIVMGEIKGDSSRYIRIKNIMKITPEEFGFEQN